MLAAAAKLMGMPADSIFCVPTPEAAAPEPQAGAQGREAVYVYEVRVAEGLMPRFLVEMKRLGTHGRLLRKE